MQTADSPLSAKFRSVIDHHDQCDILALLEYFVVTLAALQSCLCFMCHILPLTPSECDG